MTPADEIARLRATVDRKDEQMAVLQDEIERLRREHDKRLEEYATENAALRDRIKGEHMSYLAECKYKEEIADLATRLGAEVATTQRLKAALRHSYAIVKAAFVSKRADGRYWNDVDPSAQVRIKAALREHIDAAIASGNGAGGGK